MRSGYRRSGRALSPRERDASTRRLLAGLALLAAGRSAQAQQAGKAFRIGATVRTDTFYEAFLQGLVDAGWVPGQNAVLERRSVGGERERVAAMVAELVALRVDVILATGSWTHQERQKATSTIPVVGLDLESDPVASGFAASLARPGGSITGIFLDLPELSGKQLQFLRDTVPALARVAVLWEPEIGEAQLRATETAARMIGITLNALGVGRAEEIRPALERAARARAQALVVLTSPLLANNRRQIVELTQKYRLPAISSIHVLCRGRHADGLWPESTRDVPARRQLCRQDPQRRQGRRACRSNARAGSSWRSTSRRPRPSG